MSRRGRGSGKGRRRGGEARGKGPDSPNRALDGLAGSLAREAATLESALEAELWASGVEGTWRSRSPLEAEATASFAEGLVGALERRGGDGARAGLTALAGVCSEPVASQSAAAAERLAGKGASEPAWAGALGEVTPTAAHLMHDETFDDGVNVLVEFDHPDGTHVLGVYIDNNLGVMAKDAFIGGTLEEIEAITAARSADEPVTLEPLALEAAAARIAVAVDLTDHTLEAPVGEDYWSLRALIDARLRVLPDGGAEPDRPEISVDERDRLVQTFRASEDGAPFATDEEALDIVSFAIGFCADYVDGRPLRWSPVVVELFMAHWLPRKAIAYRSLFERVPEVLPAWIRHAGRLRGIPAGAIEETVASVGRWTEELLEGADGQASLSPEDLFDDDEKADEERLLEEWAEAERQAAGVVAEALAQERGKPPPATVATEVVEVRAAIRAGTHPISWVARAAGLGPAPQDDGAELLLACASATISPREATGLDSEEESMLLSLELGDWAGAVIEIVREGAGARAGPRDLVAAIDRCPEIDGAAAREDMGLVEAALSTAQLAWIGLGLVDREDRLTEVGAWVLPRALTRAWGVDFDNPTIGG